MPNPRKAKPTSTAKHGSAHDAKVKRMIKKIRRYHRLGKLATKTRSSIKDFAEKHELGEMTMRQARAFADIYKTKKDLDKLCKLRRAKGLPLQWGYIPYLLTVKDRQVRTELQQLAAQENWSAAELYAEISLRRIGPAVSKGGRPVKDPKSPTKCLLQIVTDARPWIRRCKRMEVALATMVEERTPKSFELARTAKDELRKLARHASSLARQIQTWEGSE